MSRNSHLPLQYFVILISLRVLFCVEGTKERYWEIRTDQEKGRFCLIMYAVKAPRDQLRIVLTMAGVITTVTISKTYRLDVERHPCNTVTYRCALYDTTHVNAHKEQTSLNSIPSLVCSSKWICAVLSKMCVVEKLILRQRLYTIFWVQHCSVRQSRNEAIYVGRKKS